MSTPAPPTRETCYFLNAIILFLFRELRDTALARRWVTKKIKVEFEELLQTKTAGRLLEGLSLRDVFLGETVPFIKTIRLLRPVAPSATGEPDGPEGEALPPATTPEELAFEAEVEYNGGFHLAIDVDLVFGKSAYLFVKLSRVVGRLRFVLTRVPFTHWFFSFVDWGHASFTEFILLYCHYHCLSLCLIILFLLTLLVRIRLFCSKCVMT